jgi:hypothetical protein
MQVSGKLLLNSAENILKERRQDNRPAAAGASGGRAERSEGAGGLNQSGVESRLLKLQASLSTVQHQYSREQSRQMYLEQQPAQIGPELQFGGEALFPEYHPGMDLDELKLSVSGQMEQLVRSLKSLQVEMENLYALNFDAPPRSEAGDPEMTRQLVEQGGLKNLDPARVAHLTRNSD